MDRKQYEQIELALFSDPRALARKTDPWTSWEAARKHTGAQLRRSQYRIWQTLRRYGPKPDHRIHELLDEQGIPQSESGARTRRNELVKLGLVVDDETHSLTEGGYKTKHWRAVELQEWINSLAEATDNEGLLHMRG